MRVSSYFKKIFSFYNAAISFKKLKSTTKHLFTTVEPRFYDRRFNDIPDLTINLLRPGKSYTKLYGAESRFNNIRFNDIPGITMEI